MLRVDKRQVSLRTLRSQPNPRLLWPKCVKPCLMVCCEQLPAVCSARSPPSVANSSAAAGMSRVQARPHDCAPGASTATGASKLTSERASLLPSPAQQPNWYSEMPCGSTSLLASSKACRPDKSAAHWPAWSRPSASATKAFTAPLRHAQRRAARASPCPAAQARRSIDRLPQRKSSAVQTGSAINCDGNFACTRIKTQTKKPTIFSVAGFLVPRRLCWWDLRGSNPRQTD